MSFLLASIPYILGFLSLAYSTSFIEKSYQINSSPQVVYIVLLLVGRALTGFGAGALSLVVPVSLHNLCVVDHELLYSYYH